MEEPKHIEHPDARNKEEVKNSIYSLGKVITWDQLHATLLEQKHLLLSDGADELLEIIVERGEQTGLPENIVAYYAQLLDLLRRCRTVGIDQAMEEFEMPLFSSKADPQAVAQAYDNLLAARTSGWGLMHTLRQGNVRAVLEREQALLLTSTADAVLQYFSEHSSQNADDSSYFDRDRTLFRRARQIGIERAWREYIQATTGKDWTWVKLFEVFDEWIYESILGEGYSAEEPRWGSAIYEGYRQGRRFLEAHPELLNPDFFEGLLSTEIAEIEENRSTYSGKLRKEWHLPPALRSNVVLEAPVYRNSRMRVLGLLEGQSLLYDVYARGGTSQAVRDAYVNAYGGFTLDLPLWVEDVLKQLDRLDHQTVEARTSLQQAYIRASRDPNVAREIAVELGRHLLEAAERAARREAVNNPDFAAEEVRQALLGMYTDFLNIYTRERYPYQWALIQKGLGEVHAQGVDRGYTDENEQIITCDKAALQVITRKVTHKSWDLTENNKNWALLQNQLGLAYATRTVGDRRANLTHAAECHKAALLVYSSEVNLYAHRDIQLDLAFLYCRKWAAEASQRGNISDALQAYRLAHEAFLAARQAHLEMGWQEYYRPGSNDEFFLKGKDIVKWETVRRMYAYDAWCLLQLGDLPAAVVALEEGRAQALAQTEAIASTELEGVCEHHAQEFIRARQHWSRQHAQDSLYSIFDARFDFLRLRAAIREHCQPDFLPGQPNYDAITQAAPNHALVYITAMEQKGAAFVVPPSRVGSDAGNRAPLAIALPKLTWQQVDDWLLRDDEKHQYLVGGYQFALQHQGAELLLRWVYSINDEQEQERRLAMPLSDLPAAISVSFITLRVAISNFVNPWRAEAEYLANYTNDRLQNRVRELRSWLEMPLTEALEEKTFTSNLNWFLQKAELEQLQRDLSETVITDLRRELDRLGLGDPNQPIAIIPCGRLGMLPLHAAWARRDSETGELIPLLETCELTYQASARSLAAAQEALNRLPKKGPIVAIGNPQPTSAEKLEWAEAEAQGIVALASLHGRFGSQAIVDRFATRERIMSILDELRAGPSGAWVQIASHGRADPTDSTNCYLLLSQNEKLTLADLQRERLLGGLRGFNASGCVTALGDLENAPDELSSFAAGILQAGAPCAVATLWSVKDKATFLLMLCFMEEWLQHHTLSPARALREAAHWLRTATHEQLDDLANKGLKGIRSLPAELMRTRDALRGDLESMEEITSVPNDALRFSQQQAFALLPERGYSHAQTNTPFGHAIYWAAAIIYGV